MTKLNALMEKCFAAYDEYEFLAATHAVNDFCVVDMSNFYLDVIKDRLYCDETEGALRRSAQTALYLILDAMTRIMAPILCFTCDEIWQAMPHREGDDPQNVLFNDMHKPFTDYALDAAAMERWAVIEDLRDKVNAALEAARNEKTIGKSLEAAVTLTVPEAEKWLAETPGLADLLIVSQVTVNTGSQTAVDVRKAEGGKCERCWKVLSSVGSDPDHPTLCPRCSSAVKNLPQF